MSLFPGLLIAYFCWRLPEPSRGTADRAHVTHSDEMELAEDDGPPLFPHGFRRFLGDMTDGLRKDVGTILRIPTMRYALVGVSTVGFVVTAVATWMPNFYQNQLHLTQQAANGTFGALAILGGIPGTIIGGRIADKWVNRFLGARVVIPAVCIVISAALFMVSFIPMAFGLVFVVQLAGFLAATACVPALRAGLSDAAPAQVRGAGFGAFNLASVVFGSAAAPLVTSAIAAQFGGNYRTAFLIILPIAFLGAGCLMLARTHIERDAAKVFEAVVTGHGSPTGRGGGVEQRGRGSALGQPLGGLGRRSRRRGRWSGGRGRDVARQRGALALDVGERLAVPDLDHAVARAVAVAVDDVGRRVVAGGGHDDRHVDRGHRGRVEPVDGHVARLRRVVRPHGVPGAVVGAPDVEAGGVGVEIPRRQLVRDVGAGLLPRPGGEVGAPLLVRLPLPQSSTPASQ